MEEKSGNYEDIVEIKELYKENGELSGSLTQKGNAIERQQQEITELEERLRITGEDCQSRSR